MPKKSAAARGNVQRNRPKVQKSFELVRPGTFSTQQEETLGVSSDELIEATDTMDASPVEAPVELEHPPAPKTFTVKPREATLRVASKVEEPVVPAVPVIATSSAPKGSAAAKLAARRQANIKAQQRAAASLITAEHFVYVRKDLRFIAILAAIMFAVIIILHFVPGIGS